MSFIWAALVIVSFHTNKTQIKRKGIKKPTLERNHMNVLNMVKHLYISVALIITKVFILPFTETLWMEAMYNFYPSQLSMNAIYTGGKPYECAQCGKVSMLWNLHRSIKIQTPGQSAKSLLYPSCLGWKVMGYG